MTKEEAVISSQYKFKSVEFFDLYKKDTWYLPMINQNWRIHVWTPVYLSQYVYQDLRTVELDILEAVIAPTNGAWMIVCCKPSIDMVYVALGLMTSMDFQFGGVTIKMHLLKKIFCEMSFCVANNIMYPHYFQSMLFFHPLQSDIVVSHLWVGGYARVFYYPEMNPNVYGFSRELHNTNDLLWLLPWYYINCHCS